VCDQAYWLYGTDTQAYPHSSTLLLVLFCDSALATCFLRMLYRNDNVVELFSDQVPVLCMDLFFVGECCAQYSIHSNQTIR